MQTKIIEATNGFNWGKFLLGRLDSEWDVVSAVDKGRPLLRALGWHQNDPHLWVFDLQTGEGAHFRVSKYSHASADLNKHRIWVCPMFEPFLQWLYQQDVQQLDALPALIELNVDGDLYGYRREGKGT